MPRRPCFEVRSEAIAGLGAFATRRIRKGTRIIEYTGERISPREAAGRYDDHVGDHAHVVLFEVDKRTVIDAGVGGNDARFFNHSCAPNCEAVLDEGRVYLEAIRTIQPGEELTYDYGLEFLDRRARGSASRYSCRCGAPNCRGTMLGEKRKRSAR